MDRYGYTSATAENEDGREPTVTHLVSGIASDLGRLIEQQAELLRAEIRLNLRRTRDAAVLSAVGAAMFALAGMALVLTVGLGLNALFPDLPLWASFGCVLLALVAVGALVLYLGGQKWRRVHPFPEESAQALKENLQCLNTKPKL